MEEKWTDRLRKEMDNYQSSEIPEGLWEGIEQKLDAPRTMPLWKRYAAAAAVAVLLCGSVGMLFMQQEKAVDDVVAKQSDRKVLPMSNQEVANEAPKGSVLAPKAIPVAKLMRFFPPSIIRCGETIPDFREQKNAENQMLANADAASAESGSSPKEKQMTPSSSAPQRDTYTSSAGYMPHEAAKGSLLSRLSARIFTALSQQGGSPSTQGYVALSSDGVPDNTRPLFSKSYFGKLDNLIIENALDPNEHPVTETNHSQPMRVGLSVGYDISPRWTLSAGLAYTRLHSTLTSGTSHSYFTNDQNIHYLGVPLSISYNVVNASHLRLYGSVGGMLELGVSGNVVVNNITKNKLVSTERNNVSDIPVQPSADAAVGVEYTIGNGIGLYAEPGLSYYFRNTDKLKTYYTEHPLTFNMHFGVRWNVGK